MNATCGGRSLPSRAAHIWDGWAEGHVGETAHPILLVKPSEAHAVPTAATLDGPYRATLLAMSRRNNPYTLWGRDGHS